LQHHPLNFNQLYLSLSYLGQPIDSEKEASVTPSVLPRAKHLSLVQVQEVSNLSKLMTISEKQNPCIRLGQILFQIYQILQPTRQLSHASQTEAQPQGHHLLTAANVVIRVVESLLLYPSEVSRDLYLPQATHRALAQQV